ncbi:MAG TPA: hypothetical protein VFG87_05015 [Amycolatopsis sp.]|nr:hypothetical protein [Amycolatopsis sp.]
MGRSGPRRRPRHRGAGEDPPRAFDEYDRGGVRMVPAAVALAPAIGSLLVGVPADPRAAAAVFFVTLALCLTLVTGGMTGGFHRPSAAYLVLFGLFHGGLLLAVAVRGAGVFPAREVLWLYAGYTPDAVGLAVLGMAMFTFAAGLARAGAHPAERAPRVRPRFVVVGMVCLLAGAVAVGAAPVIRSTAAPSVLGYGMVLLGCGAVLAVIAGGRVRGVAWLVFGVSAVVAFPSVARDIVLFTGVALLMVEIRQGRRIRPLCTFAGGGSIIVLSGLIGPVVLPGSTELGYSLRQTVAALAGEPFDYRLFHFGGSPIATGYHAGGTTGVVLLMVIIGCVFGRLDSLPRTATGNALAGIALLPLLVQTVGS